MKWVVGWMMCCFWAVGLPSGVAAEKKFFTPKKDREGLKTGGKAEPGLPNVLIIGDSISIGYTRPVVAKLDGVANVQRAKANCGDTHRGLNSLDKWLGKTKWDVIHFNWGLHDLCYRHPKSKVQGNRDKANGTQAIPVEQYAKNIEKLVVRLKKTDATLIWASTTFVPEGEAGRVMGDDVKYNAAAARIMKKHGVAINDLHALTAGFDAKLFTAKGNVHFTQAGSAKLAEQVAASVRTALAP